MSDQNTDIICNYILSGDIFALEKMYSTGNLHSYNIDKIISTIHNNADFTKQHVDSTVVWAFRNLTIDIMPTYIISNVDFIKLFFDYADEILLHKMIIYATIDIFEDIKAKK